MSSRAKQITLSIVIALAGLAFGAYSYRSDLMAVYREWRSGPIPPAVTRSEFESDLTNRTIAENVTEAGNEESEPAEEPAPEEPEPRPTEPEPDEPVQPDEPTAPPADTQPDSFNLHVPFMVQAPTANWDELHGEACEEASAIMLAAYYEDETEITVAEAEERIMEAVEWEQATLGYHLDTTAAETALMLREHFGLDGAVAVQIDSLDDIRSAIADGHPVIVPAYGKALGNPYFRNGGPLYHMLLIKGFSGDRLITNDPGTRRGADYVYDAGVLWEAIHDWNNGDVPYGPKMMIVVR